MALYVGHLFSHNTQPQSTNPSTTCTSSEFSKQTNNHFSDHSSKNQNLFTKGKCYNVWKYLIPLVNTEEKVTCWVHWQFSQSEVSTNYNSIH